jgi:hypothetical protein
MKIRSDFVTNSSTTSFVIISKGKFTKKKFFDLVGLQTDSPLTPIFQKLFLLLEEKMNPLGNSLEFNENIDLKRVIDESLKEGKFVYTGRLSSDDDILESYFCTDSFEIKDDKLYINGVNCAW